MGKYEIKFDGRFIQGDEKTTYGGVALAYGLAKDWAIDLKGAFASFKTHVFPGATIRTGGTDREAQIRYAVQGTKGLTLSLGASDPNTPNQNNAFLTGSAIYGMSTKDVNFNVGAIDAYRNHASLAAITVGLDGRIAEGFSWLAEGDFVFHGDNTFDLNGNAKRVSTYAVGVKYKFMKTTSNDISIIAAWTNALGDTTAMQMTPGLNNSSGIYVGVSVRG